MTMSLKKAKRQGRIDKANVEYLGAARREADEWMAFVLAGMQTERSCCHLPSP